MEENKEIKQQNERIAQKISRIDTQISLARNVEALYETFFLQTAEEFEIPYIWFSFIHNADTDGIIQTLELSDVLKDRLNRIDAVTFAELIHDSKSPVLANNDLKRFFKLLPKNNKYFIKSLAVAPISLNGAVIGSLNCGDADRAHYSPDMDATLLQGLADRFSSLLSNMMASAKQKSQVSEGQPIS
jgi:uncharacterized protein YigA (DUF484 family)